MRRYNTIEQGSQSRDTADDDRKQCFTSNYLVFSLNERMPQLTGLYLEKEDSVLDYCKTVNFNRAGGQQTFMLSDVPELPDEIDGDALVAVVNKNQLQQTADQEHAAAPSDKA